MAGFLPPDHRNVLPGNLYGSHGRLHRPHADCARLVLGHRIVLGVTVQAILQGIIRTVNLESVGARIVRRFE